MDLDKPAVRKHSHTAPKQGDRPAQGEAGPRLGVSGHRRKHSLSLACPRSVEPAPGLAELWRPLPTAPVRWNAPPGWCQIRAPT